MIGRLEQRLHLVPRSAVAEGSGTRRQMGLADELHLAPRPRPGPRHRHRLGARSARRPSASCAARIACTSAMSTRSSGRFRVRTKSCRRSATTQPSALVIPGRAGTSTRGIASSRARSQACSGPAPPKAKSAKSRGSAPSEIDTIRIAPAIWVLPDPQHRLGRRLRRQPQRARRSRSAERRAHRLQRRRRRTAPAAAARAAGWHPKSSARCRRGHSRSAPDRCPRSRARPAACPPGIDPRDRAAAGADGAHIDHRHMDRHGIFQLDLVRHRRPPAADQRHIGRGAAHVIGDQVRHPGPPPGIDRRHHPGGRARHHRLHRLARHQPRRDHAAIAVHHQKIVAVAARRQLVRQPGDIALQQRLHRGIDRRRHPALELAAFATEARGRR